MPSESSPSYRVVHSEVARTMLEAQGRLAGAHGLGPRYLQAVRYIQKELHARAAQFGELRFHLRDLGLDARIGGYDFVYCHYAVDRNRRIAYVSKYITRIPTQ